MKILSDDEIREEIAKAGGYAKYREAALNYDELIETPQTVRKSAGEIFLDSCEVIAKHRGQSIGEFFKANPSDYAKYRALVSVRA